MADTLVKIATATVGSGGSGTINFLSIPSTYTDLCLKFSGRTDTAAVSDGNLYYVSFNGSSTNFTKTYLYGTGSTANYLSTANNVYGWINPSDYTASTFGNAEIYIPNYTSSAYKSFSIDAVTENNAATAFTTIISSLWSNTAAINQITFTSFAGSFAQYSTATLYGIKNS